ncbi:MAG TPA: hydrogenase expression/formation protein HypE [Candidatus Binatia bacterium]|jgi:hydrogenase expression/formation protein HypE
MKINGFEGAIGALSCPLPVFEDSIVQLAHGGGGRKSAQLIESMFVPAFASPALEALGDGALLDVAGTRLAFSTDSFVVQPVFFPGGDIGSLAVHGTVNDLAMCGAEPVALSVAFVLEEGFPTADLRRIVSSMAAAASACPVPIVTGDTKVVDRGKGDGIYVNTSGIGRVRRGIDVGPRRARPGDAVLVSGPVGDHGIAVMSARSGLEMETSLVSDSACVLPLVRAMLDAVPSTRTLRDPTRGGLATALCEIALSSGVGVTIDEAAVPVRPEVRAACELLGFDPLYVACEGRFLAIVPNEGADRAVAALRAVSGGESACRIGEVTTGPAGRVLLRTGIGSHRRLERLSGEQLPRIC